MVTIDMLRMQLASPRWEAWVAVSQKLEGLHGAPYQVIEIHGSAAQLVARLRVSLR